MLWSVSLPGRQSKPLNIGVNESLGDYVKPGWSEALRALQKTIYLCTWLTFKLQGRMK